MVRGAHLLDAGEGSGQGIRDTGHGRKSKQPSKLGCGSRQGASTHRTAERRRGAITHWHWLESEGRRAGEPKVGRDQAGEGLPAKSGLVVIRYDD